jgi:D-alanyl-lipoteichoic acid acyltransferase DltB (MBOAT superfamily)
LFNSYAFLLVFLPAAIAIYRVADNYPHLRIGTLVVLSLIFYGYWDVRFVPLMLASILLNWWASRLYAAIKRPAVIALAVAANLAVLAAFKYANFFAENVAALLGTQFELLPLLLPLGISFFTFHHIMYLVDLGRGRAPLYPLDRYALHICFFPQSISGPLARWNEVMDQFGRAAFGPGWERRCVTAALFIVVGLLQKVLVADPLGTAIDPDLCACARRPLTRGRRLDGASICVPDLLRFFRIFGHCDRLRADLRHRAAAQLRRPVPRRVDQGVLAPLAHDIDTFSARLSLHSAGWKSLG